MEQIPTPGDRKRDESELEEKKRRRDGCEEGDGWIGRYLDRDGLASVESVRWDTATYQISLDCTSDLNLRMSCAAGKSLMYLPSLAPCLH